MNRCDDNEIHLTKNFIYDTQNRLVKTTIEGDDDDYYYKYIDNKTVNVTAYEGHPDYFTSTFYYNENNQIIKLTSNDDGGTEVNFKYDDNNNLTTINFSSERGNEYIEIFWVEGNREQALFAKNNMEYFTNYTAPFNLTNKDFINAF